MLYNQPRKIKTSYGQVTRFISSHSVISLVNSLEPQQQPVGNTETLETWLFQNWEDLGNFEESFLMKQVSNNSEASANQILQSQSWTK